MDMIPRESTCRNCHRPIFLHRSGWTHGCGFIMCQPLWAPVFSVAEPIEAHP